MKMHAKITAWSLVAGLAFAVGACDDKKEDPKTAKTEKPKPAPAGGDAANPDGPPEEPAADDGAEEPAADDGETPTEEAAVDERVQKAADIAGKIEEDPAAVEDILADAGIERAQFEALIYEISGDPDLARQYQVARASAAS
jgi:hypothetical protein